MSYTMTLDMPPRAAAYVERRGVRFRNELNAIVMEIIIARMNDHEEDSKGEDISSQLDSFVRGFPKLNADETMARWTNWCLRDTGVWSILIVSIGLMHTKRNSGDFLDSNIPLYAADDTDPVKQQRAREILNRALSLGGFVISVQVLNEFANIALKKMKRTPVEVREFVTILRAIETLDLNADLTMSALSIKEHYGIQFYDSMIVAAAVLGECSEIYSEDLNDGQVYNGVRAVNPFKEARV